MSTPSPLTHRLLLEQAREQAQLAEKAVARVAPGLSGGSAAHPLLHVLCHELALAHLVQARRLFVKVIEALLTPPTAVPALRTFLAARARLLISEFDQLCERAEVLERALAEAQERIIH